MHKFMGGGGRSYAGRWGFAGVSGGYAGWGVVPVNVPRVRFQVVLNRFRLFADY